MTKPSIEKRELKVIIPNKVKIPRITSETVENIVTNYSLIIMDKRIFYKPDIPEKKLKNAITSYANDIKEEDVLVLLDDSWSEDAKVGGLITNNTLIWKKKRIDLLIINKARYSSGGAIDINEFNGFITSYQIPHQSIKLVGEMLIEIIKCLHPEKYTTR